MNNMTYSKNELVLISKENVVKKIIDSEIVSNVEIYYMEDLTSYARHQLTKIDSYEIITKKVLEKNCDFFKRNETLIAFQDWFNNVQINYKIFSEKNKKKKRFLFF